MARRNGTEPLVFTDEQWAALEPLVEACRPRGKTPPSDLRRTMEAIVWRHRNGATWRAVPAELGPWWRAAQLFIRWAELGAWERLLEAAQARGVELGMAFLDGTSIRAHPKAAGAPKKGGPARERDRREALGRSRGGFGTKACVVADGRGRAVAFALAPGQAHELPLAPGSSTASRACRGGSWATAATARTPSASWSGRGRAAGDPDPEQRGRRRLPGVDLQQPQPGRAALGAAQGVARRRHPLREDGRFLPRRPLPRRHDGLAQALTGPSITVAAFA